MDAPTLTIPFTAHQSVPPGTPRVPVPSTARTGKAGQLSPDGRPLSPSKGRKGRPFFVDTALGKLQSDRGLKSYEVAVGAGINPRTLSDYASKKKRITPTNIVKLARFFDVPEQVFIDMNAELDRERDAS